MKSKMLILTASTFSIVTSFASITLKQYHLGTITLNSGAYKYLCENAELLGPLQMQEISTSEGSFLLKVGSVLNQSTSNALTAISNSKEIDQTLKRIYYFAANEYEKQKKDAKVNEIITLEKNFNAVSFTKEQIGTHLNIIYDSHDILERYEPLRKMLESKDELQMYCLGNKNLLIGGPLCEFPQRKFPFTWTALVNAFHNASQAKQKALKGSNEAKIEAKKLEQLAEQMFNSTDWPEYYDLDAVKKHLKMERIVFWENFSRRSFKRVMQIHKQQDYLLITFSEPMDEVFNSIPDHYIHSPLGSHASMLFRENPSLESKREEKMFMQNKLNP